MIRQVRGEDVACRYGGDEFILLLHDATREVTRERAELIRKHAGQLQHQIDGLRLGAASLSLGVAVFPEHGTTSTAILRAVDAALYRAKQEGRSRVAVAE